MGAIGFEPTNPEGNGFTVRCNSPTLPNALMITVCYYAKGTDSDLTNYGVSHDMLEFI